MRIILITQDDPFYLKKNLDYLLTLLSKDCKIVGCVLDNVAQFGRKKSFLFKSLKTLEVFGLKFFLHYSLKYIISKIKNNSVEKFLRINHIPIIELEESINSKSSVKKIKNFKPDLLVSILGGQIFKKQIFSLAPLGCINLHTSLLPKYRGVMPTFWVLKNNEKHTGVSVFFVDEGIDSGPIIVQNKFKINGRTQAELIKFTKEKGMEAIASAIEIIKNRNITLLNNDDSNMSYFTFPTRKDVIEFKKLGKAFF